MCEYLFSKRLNNYTGKSAFTRCTGGDNDNDDDDDDDGDGDGDNGNDNRRQSVVMS